MTTQERDSDQGCYVISVAARMLGVHAQTLRYYERVGLVEPLRSQGNIRLYSQRDIQHLRRIKTLIDDLGLNLAGVEVIMRMMGRMAQMEREQQLLLQEVERLRRQQRATHPGRRLRQQDRSIAGGAAEGAGRRSHQP